MRFSILAGLIFLSTTSILGDVQVLEDITYSSHGSEDQKLDLALPEGRGEQGGPRPAILFIHGGGWAEGKRQVYAGAIREMAKRGFVAATMSYRFAPKHPWPAQLEDARAAVRWLRANAAKHGIDSRRIGAGGMSAGGHLSLMLGVLPEEKTGGDSSVQAVINYFGPTDMTSDVFNDFVDGLVENLAGGPREGKAAIYREFSPLTHISPGDAPVLTFHGTLDELVPVDQARRLHAALDAARVPHRVDILDSRGHGWGGEDMARTERQTLEFLEAYLKGSDLPLVLVEDFDSGADRWEPTDTAAWKAAEQDGNRFYSLVKDQSDYKPPVRAPLNRSLLRDVEVGDFVLDVRARSTKKDYGHRDLCLFFGYKDPSHFYYVHLAKQADDRANSIFIVDGKDRRSIAKERTDGTEWGEPWRRLRLRREAGTGKIEVFFDDLQKPVMTASDGTFPKGRIGVGSFDDTGDFDEIRLRAGAAPGS